MISEQFLYKKEVNKSVLCDGFGIDRAYVDLFTSRIGILKRGEKKQIKLIFNNLSYSAIISNINNAPDRRLNDAYQIRYSPNGDFAQALQCVFKKSFKYIMEYREIAQNTTDKIRVRAIIPNEYKEYLAIYTTVEPTTFICEPILSDDLSALKELTNYRTEREFESEFNLGIHDKNVGITEKPGIIKIRKLNRKICDALKEHYQYRCQICGCRIGEKYDSHLVEAHHIEYFVKSLNNDITNIMILCPNHHGIIHDRNPKFDRQSCMYTYPNGYKEGLLLNDHLKI